MTASFSGLAAKPASLVDRGDSQQGEDAHSPRNETDNQRRRS
jgi:hypothetical protein